MVTPPPPSSGKKSKDTDVRDYVHDSEEARRSYNPPVGLHSADESEVRESEIPLYAGAGVSDSEMDAHTDPGLVWHGKGDKASITVEAPSLHRHEQIQAEHIVKTALRNTEASAEEMQELFPSARHSIPSEKLEFYQHGMGWSNRLILGDSLKVIASLLEHEKMAGKVQCIYMDPPFGINFNSNFQPDVSNLNVPASQEAGIPREPTMIKAFRDTWNKGVHSYLSYLRDRLAACRELLTDEGSLFLQMGDENFARTLVLLDEVFGAENRITLISQKTTEGASSNFLPDVSNYILWYAKDKPQMKYRQLYETLNSNEDFCEWASSYSGADIPNEKNRYLTTNERENIGDFLEKNPETKLWKAVSLASQGISQTGRSDSFNWSGRIFNPGHNSHWSVSFEGLEQLAKLDRLFAAENGATLNFKRYQNEVPGRKINNFWGSQAYAQNKRYVVQTAESVIRRCILMSTEPGDIVLDPTCGSGTTAKVSEEWGRRWITIDSSRVAIQVARERLIGAAMDWFETKDGKSNPSAGFHYKTVKTVSAAILAYDEPKPEVELVDQPIKAKSKITRVSGPFTIEGLSLPALDPYTHTPLTKTNEEIVKQVILALQEQGIPTAQDGNLEVENIDLIHNSEVLWATGTCIAPKESRLDINQDGKVSFGVVVGHPYSPITMRLVDRAMEESETLDLELLVFAGLEFDPHLTSQLGGGEYSFNGTTCFTTLVQLDNDILLEDLLKKPAEGFPLKPYASAEIEVRQIEVESNLEEMTDDESGQETSLKWQVEVRGYGIYDPVTGNMESFSNDEIRCWMLDTDYNGEIFSSGQVFFPGVNQKNRGWKEVERTLKGTIDESALDSYDSWESIPFSPGENACIAVRVISGDGTVSERIKPLKETAGTDEGELAKDEMNTE